MSTFFQPHSPQPPDVDHAAEREEKIWEHYCRIARSLDVGELITAICNQLRGESGDTPLSALLEDWLQLPQWDWQHPLITPMQAESVGRYVAGVAAEVVAQAITQALARA
jgi:hypothetical protein